MAFRIVLILLMLWFQLGPAASLVLANPSGEQVIAGGATFDRAGSTLTINQGSDKVIINWQDFSIGAGEVTNFIQPSATSAALNRVISQNVSEIYGNLNANGQVYLINPNGLVVGATGVINTQSFIASTHDVSNAEFLAGGDLTFNAQGSTSNAQILNLGKISADGGDVILIAQQVTNAGTISAPGGTAALAAGTEVLVKASGEERVFIQSGSGSGQVENSGLIAAATAELKAAGGNEYALAINNSGIIRATGVEKSGGRVFLRASSGTVEQSGTIAASRKSQNSNPNSQNEQGGDIQILGSEIELTDGSLTDASGTETGGTVHIGGGFQGQPLGDAPNAQEVTVAAGAQIKADGGDGLVVLWSDGSTVFAGDIAADGQGFVEVSGKERLSFIGTVDTQGGTLLLDPNNVEIGSFVTLAGASLISVGALTTALASNHVIINTSGTDGEDGDIRVSEAVLYNSTFDLTFLAHRHVEFNASVQNGLLAPGGAAGDTGAINIVAGWNETLFSLPGTASATAQLNTDTNTFDFAALVAADAFGANNGSVFIGDGTQTVGIAVGSRFGATNVATYDLNAQAGTVTDSFAQLGFNANDGNLAPSIDTDGAVTVAAQNDLTFSGGSGVQGHAQLGHGGLGGNGNHAGAIMITSANDLIFTAGGNNSYAQLGHGGIAAEGDHSGDITIGSVNDLVFQGNGERAYAQLGHGGLGELTDGDQSGAITIVSANDLTFTAGASPFSYVQLGHGGRASNGDHSGDIMIMSVNDVSFRGVGGFAYAQLGHGDATNNATGTRQGDITVLADGEISLQENAFAQALIGHATTTANGISNANVTIQAASLDATTAATSTSFTIDANLAADIINNLGGGNVTLLALGANGTDGDLVVDSAIATASTNDLNLLSTQDVSFNASVQNGGLAVGGAAGDTGAVNVVAGLDPAAVANLASFDMAAVLADNTAYGNNMGSVFIGDGTQTVGIAMGSRFGATNVATYDLSAQAGTSFAQLGFNANDGNGATSIDTDGAITVAAQHDLNFRAGGGTNDYAQLGHGGFQADGDHRGDITISHANDVSFSGGGVNSYAQLGHGGNEADGNHSGDITIENANDVSFSGGSGANSYAQLGHGGGFADGDRSGAITIRSVNDLIFSGGSSLSNSYAQLGHGGVAAAGNHSGDITIGSVNDVTFSGERFNAYAQLGHGGAGAAGNHSGDIMIGGANDVTFSGGSFNSHAQLGHGGAGSVGNHSGDITIGSVNDVILRGGGGAAGGYAQLGHGGVSSSAIGSTSGTRQGDITVLAQGEILLEDGTGADADARIGHVTTTVSGISNTDVTIQAASLGAVTSNRFTIDANLAASLINNGDNVTLLALGANGDDGDLVVDAALVRASTGDLNLLSTGDVTFNASVQNGGFTVGGAAGDTGAVNVVAGIDPAAVTDLTNFDIATILADNTVFGNNMGSVFIGDGTQTVGIAVGSRFGATNVATYDLTARAGTVTNSFAQLGFNAFDGFNATVIDTDGAITVAAQHDLRFSGGAGGDTYAQLGHGGVGATGNHSGGITIGNANDLSFVGGAGSVSYAQLGHGGASATGNHSGNITIGDVNDLTFITGGSGSNAYAQLGHGGVVAAGNHSGDIMIRSANDLTFSGGSGVQGHAQLGHGGAGADGNHSGDIQVVAEGSINLTGGGLADRFARIGHGDELGDGDAGNTVSGDVTVLGRGGITLTNGELGHLIDADGTYASGDTLVGTEGNLVVDAVSQLNSAPTGTGELRIYVTDAASDQVDGAALFNGVARGGLPLPNNQGSFAFGVGPYAPNTSATGGATVNGNFAYYALAGILFNFEVDTVAEATAITDALVLGDVTLAFDVGGRDFGAVLDLDGGTQFITIDEALIFNSPNDLNFITTGDIDFNASVQNGGLAVGGAAGDTGAVNIVAGFDGSQPSSNFDFSDFSNAIANTALFGNNNGSVFIGDGTQTSGIAVGSRFGATNVATYDLTAQAGTVANSFTQLGFNVFDGFNATVIDTDGAITVAAQHDLTFSGGAGFSAYAQLGHGGFAADGNHSGAITIENGNFLDFVGGGEFDAYAQLGHGGVGADGNHSGDITIENVNDLIFSGAGNFAYAQLGHGGAGADGNHSGDITIENANDLSFVGGAGSNAYAQLGHGGVNAFGNHSGAITIENANDLTFRGSGVLAYAQLGHGGANAFGNHSGDITIENVNDLIFSGAGNFAYAQLGHGGVRAAGDHSGAITIGNGGNLIFVGGAGFAAYAQLGHGDASGSASGTRQGDITVLADGEISQVEGTGAGAEVRIGHATSTAGGISNANVTIQAASLDATTAATSTSFTIDANLAADIINNLSGGNVTLLALGANGTDGDLVVDSTIATASANDLNLLSTQDVSFNASVQNGGFTVGGAAGDTGAVNIVAGLNPAAVADLTSFDITSVLADNTAFGNNIGSVFIGDGTQTVGVAVGSRFGATNVATYDLNAQAGTVADSFARLGFSAFDGGFGTPGAVTAIDTDGAITLAVQRDLIFSAGAGSAAYAQLGHGGNEADGNHSGDITIEIANDLTFSGGGGFNASAQLGHGGNIADGNHRGDIMITGANNLTFSGGAGTQAYVQLGHGGIAADGDHSGAIMLIGVNDLSFSGGGDFSTYAQLGHGGTVAEGDHSGDITITGANDLIFSGGGGTQAYVQLGHGGLAADGDHSGEIMITGANDLSFSGGGDFSAYAQLGHGGSVADGNHSGDITISGANDLSFSGGVGTQAYAQLGNGGLAAIGNHSGDIMIDGVNDLIFSGSGGFSAYAQLGHGGAFVAGDHSGGIMIGSANDLSFSAGAGSQAYAQLGHGGHDANGHYSGGIEVALDGDLVLTGVDATERYAMIGHGDEPGDGDSGDTVSGHVSVLVNGNATLSNAFIGHQIDADGTYTSGNTFIGVGGDLTADAASQFNSAPGGAGVGELRVYLIGSDNVNAATLFNGTAHGAAALPNNQGTFNFGEGPYAPTFGNFAYYGLNGTFSYIVDTAEAAAIVAALGGGDVTLRSDLNQAAFGAFVDLSNPFIQIDSDISYASDNALNLIALGDVTLNAGITNTSTTGGDINVVAGWDESTTAIADILADPAAYGNNGATVTFGDISTARGDINLFGFHVAGSGADLETAENGRITIDALGNLRIDNSSSIVTDRGRIRLTGNDTDADTSGDFSGVEILDNSVVVSTDGNVIIRGRGGDSGSDNAGILLQDGGRVGTLGDGNVTLVGRGGGDTTGADNNGVGVRISNAGVGVVDGDLSITGTGDASGDNNEGIEIQDGSLVGSIGDGSVTLMGTGRGRDSNEGVQIEDIGTTITSVTGNISITGESNGRRADNTGVNLEDGALVESTGTGATAADIIIVGTGGAGTDNNVGVLLSQSAIESEDGNISITGNGGAGTGEFNIGVSIFDISSVLATGTGGITVLGNGGTGTNELVGAEVFLDSVVFTVDGDLIFTGNAGTGSGDNHFGVGVYDGAGIASSGAGNVTVTGTSSNGGTGSLIGVFVEGTFNPSAIGSTDGDLIVRGFGGNGTGDLNTGVSLFESGLIGSFGTGNILVEGVGGTGDTNSFGVEIVGVSPIGGGVIPSGIVALDGNVEVRGTGGTETSGTSEAIFADSDAEFLVSDRLTLTSTGGDILVEGAVLVDELLVQGTAADTATIDNALNDVNTLAAAIGSINFANTDDLIIGTVDTTMGITTELVDGISVEARSGILTVDEMLVANNGGEIFLRVGRDAAGQVDLNAMQTTTGDFIIRGGDFADTFNLRTVSSRVVVRGQDGDDIFNIGNLANSLDDITADIVVRGQDSAGDILNINDQGDTDANTYDISDNTRIQRIDGATSVSVNYDDSIEVINLNGGTSTDDILRGSTSDDTFTLITADSGTFSNPNLLFDVNWTGIALFNGQGTGDNDTVDYSALAGPVTVRLNTTVRNIENLIGTASGADILEGRGQDDTFEFAGGTITVDLLTITGFEDIDGRGGNDSFTFNSGVFTGTVAGSGGDDTFNFMGGTVTTTVTGNAGDDTFLISLGDYAAPTAFAFNGGNDINGDTVQVNGGTLEINGAAGTVTDGTVAVNVIQNTENLTVNAGSALVSSDFILPGALEIESAGDVNLNGALTASEVLIQGSTLFLKNTVTSTLGDITLVAGTSFQNTGGALNPAGRFLVYSVDPFDDVLGGLIGSAEFGLMFPDLPGFSGSGFVYSSSLNNSVNGQGVFLNQQLQNALAQLLLDGFDAQTVDDLKAFLQTEEGQQLLQGSGSDKDGLENILIWLSGFDVASN